MAQGITSNFGQILEAGQNARYDRQAQRDIAEMKYGNRGGGSSGGNDLDWAKFGLEMAAQKQKMQAMQQEMDKRAIQDLKDAKMRIALLNHQKAKSKNPKEIDAFNRQIQAERQTMYAIYAPGEEGYESTSIGDAIKQSTGISNPMPFAGSAHPSLTEQAASGFNQWATQNGFIKINPKTRAEVEREQAMTPAEEQDMGAWQQDIANTQDDGSQAEATGLIPTIANAYNKRKANRAEYKQYKEEYANSGMTTADGKPGKPQSYRQWLKNGKGQTGINGNDIQQDEGNEVTTQHGQPVKTAEQAGPIEVFAEDIEEAVRTGDMSSLPPEIAAHLGSYLSNIEMGQTADGNMAIVDHNTIMDLLGADDTAKLNEQDYRMQQYMPQQAMQAEQDAMAAADADVLLNNTVEGKQYMNQFTAANAHAQELQQGMALSAKDHQAAMAAKSGTLQSNNIRSGMQNYNPEKAAYSGNSQFQQLQGLGGGGGNSSKSNDKINPHAVGTEALQKTLQATNGVLGNTPIPPEKADFNSALNLLLASNDMKGVRQLIDTVGNEQMINPKTGKKERIRDIFANESRGVDKKYSGSFATLQDAQQEALSKVGTDNNVLLSAFNNLVSYMPGDIFGGATDRAKVDAMRIAMSNNSKMTMRGNGMIYTGTKDDIKNMGSRNMAYMFEINRANAAHTINSIDQAIAGSADMFEKIALAEQRERLTNFVNYTQTMFDVANTLGSKLQDYIPTTGYQANTDTDDNIHIPLQHPKYSAIIKTADNNYMLQDNNGTMFTVPLKDFNKYIK